MAVITLTILRISFNDIILYAFPIDFSMLK